jgi:hypothetical protein
LDVPEYATFASVSTAGVDHTPAPAKSSSGCFGGCTVQVFLRSLPVPVSRKVIEPWNAKRSASSPSSAEPAEMPSISTPSKTTGLP